MTPTTEQLKDLLAKVTPAPCAVKFRIISRAQPGPVRTVTTTRRVIVPGVYGRVGVERVTRPYVHLFFSGDSMLDSDELTAAIATLTAIAAALRESEK